MKNKKTLLFIMCSIFTLTLTLSSFESEGINSNVQSSNTEEFALNIDIDGDVAFIATGSNGVYSINIKNIDNHILVGSYDTIGTAFDIEIYGNTAYIADGESGLTILNITDPKNMILISTLDTQGICKGVKVSGNTAYIADGLNGLRCINITDPSSPSEIGFYNSNGDSENLIIEGNVIYLADDTNILSINVQDPTNPTLLDNLYTDGDCSNLVADGNLLFVANGDEGILIIDITNPTNLREVSSIDTDGTSKDISVIGNEAYIADGSEGLVLINVENITNPIKIATFDNYEEIHCLELYGNYLVYGQNVDSNNLEMLLGSISIGSPIYPALIASYDPWSSNYYDLEISRDHAFLSSGLDMDSVNISNELAYSRTNWTDISGGCVDLELEGDILYTSLGRHGIGAIDVTDVNNLVEIGVSEQSYQYFYGTDIAIDGNYAFLVYNVWENKSSGLRCYDIFDPSNPTLVSDINISSEFSQACPYDIEISGDIAYIANGFQGLAVVDISNPEVPNILSIINTTGESGGVKIHGNYLYMTNYEGALEIYNITTPAQPILITAYTPPSGSNLYDVEIFGDLAYLANGDHGFSIINVTNFDDIYEISHYNTFGKTMNLKIIGDKLYLSDYDAGLLVFKVNQRSIDDFDLDKLTYFEEINIYHTNPMNEDTDYDTFSDFEEIEAGTNPLDSFSNPKNQLYITILITTFLGSISVALMIMIKERRRSY